MKAYMLAQWAFWLQQVLVIHIEERRKDHWQMLTHHFLTIGLIAASYAYHQTRVGHLILVLMDIVDLFFPVSCDSLSSWNGMLIIKPACEVPQVPGLHHSM